MRRNQTPENGHLLRSTSKRVSVSLNQMVRNYRNSERSQQGVSSEQRRADALANLITGEGPHQRPKVTLLMIADYDTVTRELRNLRYDDGIPVPADQIARLAAGAKILPAIFDADGDPLWLGRAQRAASAGQRIVLAVRDGGCVNCGSPVEGTEPHHIEWFSRGGATDIDNLALLCERCHHLIHDDGWQLHRNNGQHQLHRNNGQHQLHRNNGQHQLHRNNGQHQLHRNNGQHQLHRNNGQHQLHRNNGQHQLHRNNGQHQLRPPTHRPVQSVNGSAAHPEQNPVLRT